MESIIPSWFVFMISVDAIRLFLLNLYKVKPFEVILQDPAVKSKKTHIISIGRSVG
jgi:hypothetical protein